MKADKKKAREELDIVNVIEWRSGSNRQFLLVRRPEGGLLFFLRVEVGETESISFRSFGRP
jgi:hypothetical protein